MRQTVIVDCSHITDWVSFHDVFDAAFGFPDFYGRNRDAWIDCMTRLDEDFSKVRVAPGEVLTLRLENTNALEKSAPDILANLLEMAGFVNDRRTGIGQPPVLQISRSA